MRVKVTRLVRLQGLCARLRLLIGLFEHRGILGGECRWSGVSNLLLPAACVTRLETNAAAADLYDSGCYCEPSADYDERQSLLLDDYMSALARYHFVWNSYAAIRKNSKAGRLMTTKNAADREELAGRVPTGHLELLDRVYGTCCSYTRGRREIQKWLKNKPVEPLGVGTSGS